MTTFNVITLFPNLINEHLNYLPFKKGLSKKLIKVNSIDLRNYALDSYGSVDDKPYGGGTGMILRVEPVYQALKEIKNKGKVILLSPKGYQYNQKTAGEFSGLKNITLICGRYEGVDSRVEKYVDEVISVGNYILSGGELGALIIMESVTRLIPGILEKEDAVINESFSEGYLEHPQYTRPEEFRGQKVPKVLLSGNHQEIEKWKRKNSKKVVL